MKKSIAIHSLYSAGIILFLPLFTLFAQNTLYEREEDGQNNVHYDESKNISKEIYQVDQLKIAKDDADHETTVKEQMLEMEHTTMSNVNMHNLVSWADPNILISPPPKLMGKQMGKIHTLNVPPLGYEMDGEVKVFRLIAQPVRHVLTTGKMPEHSIIKEAYRYMGVMQHSMEQKVVKLWGYNGSVPGPTIEVYEGDRVRIILKNELPEPTSIHWHGLEVPNEMDGAGGVTQAPVMPGRTFAYEFTVHQVGTYMYHTGFNMMKQDGMGMGGLIVIHPKKYNFKIDKDFTIMLQAFAFLPGNDLPDLVTMDFNWFTFNAKAAPDIETITVKEGDRVRIRFGNLTMDSHPIHIHGHNWNVVGTEGGPIPESAQWPGNTVNIPPGTTRDVEFIAWNPGVWRIHCHKLHHIVNAHADIPMGVMPPGGMFTYFHVVPK
jgi:hypothetical protein